MHILSSLDPTLGFVAGIAVAIVVLLGLEIYNDRRITKLTAPIYEFAVSRAQAEADRIVQEAKEEARRILAGAEAASTTATATHAKEVENTERVFEGSLKSMLAGWQREVSENTQRTKEAQAQLNEKIEQQFKTEAEGARVEMAGTLKTLEESIRKQLESEMSEALQHARQEADVYRQMQKTALDSHIFELVRESVRITLQRDLPKESQADLVRAALEEAKTSGVF